MSKRILVIEDDKVVATSLKHSLSAEGYSVSTAGTLKAGRALLNERSFSLLILDLRLPDGDGLDFCKEVRKSNEMMPIFILTSRAEEEVAVQSFRIGAHEFVRKPFGAQELVARVDRLLRTSNEIRFESICVFPKERVTEIKSKRVKLSRREFDILVLILKSPGQSITRERLLEELDPEADLLDRTLDSHLSRLRRKLAAAGATDVKINSVYGVGYQMERVGKVAA